MGIVKGGFMRAAVSFLYALAFCCAAIILGIYSYFLAFQTNRNLPIPKWEQAVEGMSGVAVIYTAFAVLLTCCLGGITFFGFLAIVIDVLMIGAFIAMAVLTDSGASSCSGTVQTPIGNGPSNTLGEACRLNTAAFAVSIIGAVLFLLTALMQVFLVRHHKKEKRFGPSPSNNYTEGSGKRSRFGRKEKPVEDAELGAVGAGVPVASTIRPSHDTAYTGSTVAGGTNTGLVKDTDPAYDETRYNTQANTPAPGAIHETMASQGPHGTYYTQPLSHGDNPYGMPSSIPTNAGTGANF